MKLFMVAILIGVAAGARLPNTYLPPPSNAFSAGGQGAFLQGPSPGSFGQGGGGGGGGYGAPRGPQIPILRFENVNNGDGSYHFDYATGNGIMHNEKGHLNNPHSENPEQVVAGSYSYTGQDGRTYTVHYKADSNGFQATGDHLPTPPPIPEAIQKSLALNAAAAARQGPFGGSGGGGGGGGGYPSGRPQPQYIPPAQGPRTGSFSPGSGYRY